MQADEYERAIAAAVLPAIALAHNLLSAIRPNPMTESDWIAFLQAVFGTVREQGRQASQIARMFYDAERQRQIPGVPFRPVNLVGMSFERFVREMEPARDIVSKPDFSPELVTARISKTVENSARRTIIRAVEDPDPDLDPILDSQEEPEPEPELPPELREPPRRRQPTQLIRGWARVPTGRETCGFCWMLASRGPVYRSSGTAGARGTQQSVVMKTADGSFGKADMNQWHPNCDCKVVPVFRLDEWDGKDKYEAAKKLWEDEIKGRYSGRDALNAFRRLVEGGALDRISAPSRAA